MKRRDPQETAQDTAQASAEAMWADDKAPRALGIELVAIGPGSAEVAMTVTEMMTNGHGMCHGGYIFLVADTAFAYACNSHGQRNVAQHCMVTFISPGKLGARLTAVARECQRSERSGITDVTVIDESGVVVAEFRGHSRAIPGALTPTP